MIAALTKPLCDNHVELAVFEDKYIEGLRTACTEDTEIWQIYPLDFLGNFDASLAVFAEMPNLVRYAVLDPAQNGLIVGMTNYLNPDPETKSVEIGGTYITPSVRGIGLNGAMKDLMINHAFACGYQKIMWKVDTRNKRSQAAVLKLGAKLETILEADRVTWTGYVRDSAVFAMMRDEWKATRG